MTGLIVATEQEAAALRGRLSFSRETNAPYPTYGLPPRDSEPSVILLVCGMGKEAAARATRYLLEHYSVTVVINVGLCGALDAAFPPGTLLRVTAVCDGDDTVGRNVIPCDVQRFPDLPAVTLASVDEAVFDVQRRTLLAQSAQVVDMEGVAIAQECAARGVRCTMLKGVSDNADDHGRQTLRRNLSAVSQALAGRVSLELGFPRKKRGIVAMLCRFVRIEHTVFSLPLILAGAWLAAGLTVPTVRVLLLLVLVGTGARTLGMAMNRILDRDLDALNTRTLDRDLPSGRIGLAGAYAVAVIGLTLYLTGCAALSRLCLYLSPVPAVALLAYSLLKRFTSFCHFGIGLCLALGPAGAYVAVSGELPFVPEILLLAGFTFTWISGFDIIYAMQDIAFERAHGVYSLPAKLGGAAAQVVAGVVHVCSALMLVILWLRLETPTLSGLALLCALGALSAGYWPKLSLSVRFFPVSAIAGISGALVVLLGGLP